MMANTQTGSAHSQGSSSNEQSSSTNADDVVDADFTEKN